MKMSYAQVEKLFGNFGGLNSVKPPQICIPSTHIDYSYIVVKGRLQFKTALLIGIVDPSDLFL